MLNRHLFLLLIAAIALWCACSETGNANHNADKELTDAIHQLSFSNPYKAQEMLDSARNAEAISEYEYNYLRCLIYHNGFSDYRNALKYGRLALDESEASADAAEIAKLIDLMADECLNLGDYEESVRLCTLGLQITSDNIQEDTKANLHLTLGLNLLEMRREEEAFSHLDPKFFENIKILTTKT